MKLLFAAFLAGAACIVLVNLLWSLTFSFRSQSTDDYSAERPLFEMHKTLNGPLLAEGLIYDYTGKVTARFTGTMTGTWENNQGRLAEVFDYASGRTDKRTWVITKGPDNTFTARAGDIVGTATGEQSGNAVQWRYKIRLPESAGGHVLNVIDWMYLMDNGVILNRSEMRKFGVKVAELIATIRPAK